MLLKLLLLLFAGYNAVIADRRISLPLSYRSLNKTTHDIHRARRLTNSAPLRGDLALGYYYTYIFLGSTHQRASVILDTGSSLTALPCTGCTSCGTHSNPPYNPSLSNTSTPVSCSDKICSSLDAMVCAKENTCGYSQHYSENSALEGRYIRDQLWFSSSSSSGSNSSWNASQGWGGVSYVFGCHERETNLFQTQLADGIMGLSGSGRTITKALVSGGVISKSILSLCIAPFGGTFSMGGFDPSLHLSPPVWTALKVQGGRYCVNLKTIQISSANGGGSEQSVGTLHEFTSGYGCVLDSGTTYTYVPSAIFRSLMSTIKTMCTNCILADDYPREEHTCFSLINTTKKQNESFPLLKLTMSDEISFIVLPLQYLTKYGSMYCVSIYDNGEKSTVIGANFLQNYDTIIDLDQNKVGFAKANCEFSSSSSFSHRATGTPSTTTDTDSSSSSSSSEEPVFSNSGTSVNAKDYLPIGVGSIILVIGIVIFLLCLCGWLWKRRVGGFSKLSTTDTSLEMDGLVLPYGRKSLQISQESTNNELSDEDLEEEPRSPIPMTASYPSSSPRNTGSSSTSSPSPQKVFDTLRAPEEENVHVVVHPG